MHRTAIIFIISLLAAGCSCISRNHDLLRADALTATDPHAALRLLDSDSRVAAIGNPAINPKIRELYRRIISGSDESPATSDKPLCQNPVVAVGAVGAGETVTKRFALYNPGASPLTLQELVGSCDGTVATASSDTIPAGGSAIVTVSIAADTVPGPFLHWVDIYYNERECPERLTLHGYLHKITIY